MSIGQSRVHHRRYVVVCGVVFVGSAAIGLMTWRCPLRTVDQVIDRYGDPVAIADNVQIVVVQRGDISMTELHIAGLDSFDRMRVNDDAIMLFTRHGYAAAMIKDALENSSTDVWNRPISLFPECELQVVKIGRQQDVVSSETLFIRMMRLLQ